MATLSALLVAAPSAPITSRLQLVTSPSLRASAAAAAFVISSFLGLGVGPLLIGALSDRLTPREGQAALRFAMLTVLLCTTVWALLHLHCLILEPAGDTTR